jgi:hypothetical protein
MPAEKSALFDQKKNGPVAQRLILDTHASMIIDS